jgi:hypothetical protein
MGAGLLVVLTVGLANELSSRTAAKHVAINLGDADTIQAVDNPN